ncbi:nuclear transport factor 2 family protein [Amphritea japonica]|uniref:SnoaL-like domain-containing protein n=1 Tax=Amphritea japonica ATCC BAA-1530 TaxID=1278309 RepID=A0A7R6PCB6_9GAMM|nr:nuclear transport factor 2 family protein [Amphritea japonica]BBB26783.1 conserved hypothetical protein [Amphritea japonica ATCC BAA-1530]
MSETYDSLDKSLLTREAFDGYAMQLTQLKPDSLETLANLVAEDVCFSDPFNTVQGKASFIGVMAEMFEQLDDVRFDLFDSQIQGNVGYLYWRFSAVSSLTGRFSTEGCSRICFNTALLVVKHQDFWDASLLMQQFPLLGRLIRIIRNRAAYKDR